MFESSKFELGAPLTGSIRHCVHTETGSIMMRVTRAALVRIAEDDDSRSSSALAMMHMDQIDQLCRGFLHGKAPAPEGMLWVMDAADLDGVVPLAAPRLEPPRAFDAPDASEGMIDPAFQAWLDRKDPWLPIADYVSGEVLLRDEDHLDGVYLGERRDGVWLRFFDGEEFEVEGRKPIEFCAITREAAIHYEMTWFRVRRAWLTWRGPDYDQRPIGHASQRFSGWV